MIFDPHLTLRHTKICQIVQQKAKLIRFQGNRETLENKAFQGISRRIVTMIRVLFVCHGNICRSTMAQSMFQDMVDKMGLSGQFEIDSAATSR